MRGLILFDLDGTLVDSAPGLAAAANEMRRRRLLPPLPFEALREHGGSGARGLIWAGLRLPPEASAFDKTKQEFLEYYAQIMVEQSTLFAGVAAMLETLTSRDLAWGIVTNKVIELAGPLCRAKGLADRAACLLSGQTIGAPKPAPDALLMAMKNLGFDAAHTLYVGDDARDAQAAHNAGVRFVAANWGYTGSGVDVSHWGAARVADRPAALPALVEELL